jgi:ubiquinone/menaquinone biosynthesis C-methylase UbiE
MENLGDQYRCPKGQLGRLVAKRMNLHHKKLTLWGLTKVTLGSDYVILDVGCGGGKTISRLAQMAPRGKIFGIDYSTDMVEFSKEINKTLITQNQVEIIEESVEKMSFKDNFFDLVTAFETYYFWTNFPVALREIKRVLKPGGKLLLVNELLHGVTQAKIIEETHVRLLPLEEIQNFLRSIGFMDVQTFIKPETAWNAILAQK